MATSQAQLLNDRYTGLSDRFRSLWTFYQFLAGVYKYQGQGQIPFSYDFQGLYRRLQELVPRLGFDATSGIDRELDAVERELGRIHHELARIEQGFPPSTLRRFFDHLKKQDEKILFALVKFYLLSGSFEEDTLDKLDILLTRLSEVPLDDGRVLQRDPEELRSHFERLVALTGLAPLSAAEEQPVIEAVREIRRDLQSLGDFGSVMTSQVYDRFRTLKKRLGTRLLHPPILVEVVATNLEAKNRFRQLYQEEEVRILEDTNRIFEIERYLERNPGLASETLTRQIETFRRHRVRFDASRKEDNVRRDEILELRRAMNAVLDAFEPGRGAAEATGPAVPRTAAPRPGPERPPTQPVRQVTAAPAEVAAPAHGAAAERPPLADDADHATPLIELLPQDPLLNEFLHKIMFALELVVWDHLPEQVQTAKEIHHLRLEPWEVDAYRVLAGGRVARGSLDWELRLFFLAAAALRIRMEEEVEEIARLNRTNNSERLFEVLERSAQSLERAREFDRRFQWFVDDMLFRGYTDRLEQVYRSRFRFLNAFSRLWLDHQASGGITPL